MSNQSSDSASDNNSESASSCVSQHITFDAVELSYYKTDEQLAVLALAWILLLYRGTVDSHDGSFFWGFSSLAHDECSSGRVSDIITSHTDPLSKLLGAVQQRYQRDGQARFSGDPVFFSNCHPSEPRPEVSINHMCHSIFELPAN